MIYIIFLSITLLVLLIVLYQAQHFMIFRPTCHRTEILNDEYEYLSIISDDNYELEGIVYTPPKPNNTILYFGGRSQDSVGMILKLSKSYTNSRIITFNYRSYGKSEGVVNEKYILQDGLKIAQIIKKNYGDFYLLGFSLGSVVSAFVASRIDVLGVFMVGSFDSLASVIRSKYYINIKWFLKYKLETKKYISHVIAPVWIFGSRADETIPINNTRNLQKYIKNLKLYKEYKSLRHKEILWDENLIEEINRSVND